MLTKWSMEKIRYVIFLGANENYKEEIWIGEEIIAGTAPCQGWACVIVKALVTWVEDHKEEKIKGKNPSGDGLLKISNFILGILLGLDWRRKSKPVVMSLMLKINDLVCKWTFYVCFGKLNFDSWITPVDVNTVVE